MIKDFIFNSMYASGSPDLLAFLFYTKCFDFWEVTSAKSPVSRA